MLFMQPLKKEFVMAYLKILSNLQLSIFYVSLIIQVVYYFFSGHPVCNIIIKGLECQSDGIFHFHKQEDIQEIL